MKNDNQNFLDSRTLTAIVLVGATFIGWQYYMTKKYPETYAAKAESASGTIGAHTAPGEKASPNQKPVQSTKGLETPSAVAPEKLTHYHSKTLDFDISSKGMGIRGFKVLEYKNRQGETVELGHAEDNLLPLETRLLGHKEAPEFSVEQVNPNLFVGHAQVGAVKLTKTLEVDPEKYVLNFKVDAAGSDDTFVGLSTALSEEVEPVPSGKFLLPQRQKQEFYVETATTKERTVFGKDDVQKSYSQVRMASVGSQYFTQALIDHSAVMPEAKAQVVHAEKEADVVLQYPVLNHSSDFALNYSAFVGPKSLTLLRSVDPDLVKTVDFGFFSWIGRHILELLKMFFGLTGNWGVAIILLTLCVRLLVLPVNIYSYKSMRAMQAIQPQMKLIKEKYKDDTARQQQETMALMKQNKVNPVGGCLPMLLQFPIFIALYQVLGNSIELYQAPFGLWIHDLSLKDPFYVLPVAMGLTMFVQQKITPNTMDPAQQKVMMLMPLMFTFFMISLPSGLTLYMLVGAVFSVAQQSYFMKPAKTSALSAVK